MPNSALSGRIALDRTRQASPQIIEYLRDRILSLELSPGTVLSRTALQQHFGISQTPVRDALLKLEEEGLVTVYPQYATLVSRVNLSKVRQVHFMRRAIEADIVKHLATHHTPAQIEELRAANDKVRDHARQDDHGAFLLADKAFHHTMFKQADVELVWPVIQTNSGHLDRLRRLNLPNVGMAHVVEQHDAIIDAIAQGEPARADAALREHLANTLKRLSIVASQYPEYTEE